MKKPFEEPSVLVSLLTIPLSGGDIPGIEEGESSIPLESDPE